LIKTTTGWVKTSAANPEAGTEMLRLAEENRSLLLAREGAERGKISDAWMTGKLNELKDALAAPARAAERARLRPLLERCVELLESTGWRVQYQERAQVAIAALRAELGLPEK